MLTRSLSAAVATLAVLTTGASAAAQDLLIRSDLPLFTDAEELWPRGFSDGDSFGCAGIMLNGDYRSPGEGEYPRERWWRVRNYGVFHCAVVFYEASSERDYLNEAPFAHAWLAPLGDGRDAQGDDLELFALQIGALGGSRYLIVARPASPGGQEWRLLDAQCPRGAMRRAGTIDVWRTDYCAVDNGNTLRAMARDAARRPPTAVFNFVGRAPDTESFLPPDIQSFTRRVRECRDLAGLTSSDSDTRQWAEEAAIDYGCAGLADEAAPLSARYRDRPEIVALINALIEQGGFVRDAPSPTPPPPAEPPSTRR